MTDASIRRELEKMLYRKGWERAKAPAGWPEHSWIKVPIASTHCQETSLLGAIRRQMELEDDFGLEGWRD